MEEFGVAKADQRPDSRDNRNSNVRDLVEKRAELPGVEYGLSDRVFRSGLDFPFKAANFLFKIDRAGIYSDANRETDPMNPGAPSC